jgi:two-component system, sensor histidine kinase and response regulator
MAMAGVQIGAERLMPYRQHGLGSILARIPLLRRLAAAIAGRRRFSRAPCIMSDAGAPDPRAPLPSPSDRVPLRVLVVEDDKVNRLVVTGMLRQMAHHGDYAADGIEALHALDKSAYDVVLMDIRMPNMDGIEATRRIRRMAGAVARVPIIALTANATTEERLRCEAAGMDDFMSKPFRRAELEAKLTALRSRCRIAAEDGLATGVAKHP